MGRVCVRGCRAEVGEEGFFLGGCWSWWWRCWERLEKVWCLDWGCQGCLALGEGRRFWGVLEALLLWWMIDGGSFCR